MGVLKKYQKNKFTQVDNEVIQRADLSAKAKGILLYLMSKPEGWSPNITNISNNMTDGKDGIRSGMRELADKGYARFGHTQGAGGKLTGTFWEVADSPIFGKPDDRSYPQSDEPIIGKDETNNKEISNTELSNTDTPIVPNDETFEFWWTLIPGSRKIDKKACREKFLKLPDHEQELIAAHWPHYVQSVKQSKNGAPGWEQFVRHPKTYLNNRNWEDEAIAAGIHSVTPSKLDESIEASKESLHILDQLDND